MYTAPPSKVTEIQITFVNATTATITWQPPNNTGGRTDVFYGIECFAECGVTTKRCSPNCSAVSFESSRNNLTDTRVILANMDPRVTYKIHIRAGSGVSQVAGESPVSHSVALFSGRMNLVKWVKCNGYWWA